MPNILIVEDDKNISAELKELLNNAGYNATILTDFENSLDYILNNNFDLILLDINIPVLNGEALLKHIRTTSNVPIIMVTSKNTEVDEVLSMSYGADDYITKPYNPTILLLRISALFKRIKKTSPYINYKDLKINLGKGIIEKDGEEVILTKNEMIILSYFLNHQNVIVTRDELMTDLWNNDEYINDNALTVNISRLRSKLSILGHKDAIITRKGVGYILS